ncbi:uncharacterized protein LOC143904727 [Temnothorax americanus]|uniref:uncharacterized protein LOC143904727 n=1 Tax=Temnothorax americanus TaxID=1964332 RepID=UPI0040689CD5
MCSRDEFAINSENLNVKTCGICFDKITNLNDISKHPCFKGYKRFYHDAETSQLHPVTNFLENSSDGNDGNDDGNNDGNDDEVLQCVDDFEIEKTVNINKRINKKKIAKK